MPPIEMTAYRVYELQIGHVVLPSLDAPFIIRS